MRCVALCRDQADARRPCLGLSADEVDKQGRVVARACRCRGDYVFVQDRGAWRPPGPGEVTSICPGCGAESPLRQPRVTTFVSCTACHTEYRIHGRNPLATLWWRLFGRHEGYNRPSQWFAKTRYVSEVARRMT